MNEPLDSAGPLIDETPNAEQTLSANGREKIVRDAVNSLGADQRKAIEMAFYDGLSHRAIAERLKQPVGTVKSRIRLGMQHLRDRLAPYGDGL